MVYSQKIAKRYAIASFFLAIIEFLIAVIILLEIASNACQHPTIISNYPNLLINIICHPFLAIISQPLYYAPVFTLWLILVIPISSVILAAFSFFRARQNKWKILSLSGLVLHFLLLLAIIVEIKYEILFLSS